MKRARIRRLLILAWLVTLITLMALFAFFVPTLLTVAGIVSFVALIAAARDTVGGDDASLVAAIAVAVLAVLYRGGIDIPSSVLLVECVVAAGFSIALLALRSHQKPSRSEP